MSSRSRLKILAATVGTALALLASMVACATRPMVAQAPAPPPPSPGAVLYKSECSMCHQANRKGSAPEYPSLVGVASRFNDQELTETIQQGLPRMPGFPNLKPDQVAAIILYLKTADNPQP